MIEFHGEQTMSVTELIAELQKIPDPDNTPVRSEGCDCDGNVIKAQVETGTWGTYAYLLREKPTW